MATATKKDKFFDVLKNIFIGAKIEGESGYVNLMRIKSKYYHEFKDQLLADIDSKLNEVGKSFEEELYNKLYTFFKKYFSESGSIYFSYTPLQEKVYERIYRDDKDVKLFWKTHMLYYVKTERLYKNLEIQDEETNIFYLFDVSKLEHKKNNERKDLVFDFANAEFKDNKRQITLTVEYSKNGKKTKIDEILKQIKKAERVFNSLTEKQVERACGIFRKQSEVDYFINKNAKEFLREQFSLWVKGYLMDDETLFEADRLKQLKALQSIAFNIIDLVSQFEDELVKIWNKPKFAHSSNYVITLDRIADKDFAILEKIIKHEGIKSQIEEWQELGVTDKKFKKEEIITSNELNEKWQFLPLDTKYFKEIEFEILGLFDDLDNQLDGWLIHSENYQALNSLKNKYKETIQCVYIDPPFNTGSDFEYVDGYQDSTWLTLMADRIIAVKKLMSNTGSFYLHLDENANFLGRFVSNGIFYDENFLREIIWDIQVLSGYKTQAKNWILGHQSILFYVKNKSDFLFNKQKQPHRKEYLDRFDKEDEGGKYFDGRGDKVYLEDAIRKGKAVGDVWFDIMSFQQNSTSKEKVAKSKELTQKPEKLLERIIKGSTNERDIIIDFFSGSGTSINSAQKLKRKWIGIELGEHINDTILPRLKETLNGKSHREPCGISEDNNWQGGGFFKYYSFEQYEETLSKLTFEDKNALPNQDIYHQYIFLKDLKLADKVLKLDEESKQIKVDLTKLHEQIDIPETLSHLTGKFIKQILKDKVIFTDGSEIDLNNIDYKIVKPLIWW
jgi:adenine specific DNA methylase Mod